MNGVTARNLPPSAFAPVMATGIVSQGLAVVGARRLSDALLTVAVVLYSGLLAGLVWRVLRYPGEVAADLRNPGRLFGFFTFVSQAPMCSPSGWPRGLSERPRRPCRLLAVPVAVLLLGCGALMAQPARRGRDGAARGRDLVPVRGGDPVRRPGYGRAGTRTRPARRSARLGGRGAAVHGGGHGGRL